MKSRLKFFGGYFVATLLVAMTVSAQVALTVSPSVISNTYPGVITLNITGLTNTEKVIVQKWLDLNGNGVIDAGEPLIDAFKITDNNNANAIIGGITNLNVPMDLNSATGVITATLNCAVPLILDTMVGNFIYQVVSPSSRFAPVPAAFAVTNALLPQSVSGVVYSNDGVTPFPDAVVVAQDLVANNPAGSVVADASGHFFLTLPPGTYGLLAGWPNYYFDQQLSPMVELTNGVATTNYLTLTNGGPNTISGAVYDAGNSNGIGGLLLQVKSGHFFAFTFTDTNGNYSAAVTPSFWTIEPVKQRLARRAYVLPQATFQLDATGGSVTNANIALPRGTALFYGRLTDNLNNPFHNIEMDAGAGNNVNTSLDAKGYTDADGNYAVAVVGDNTNVWYCSATSDKNTALNGYVVNFFSGSTMSPGQTVQENFTAIPATATISGHVQTASGTNIVGVGLNAGATINGQNYQTLDATTDNSGNYSVAAAPGQWYLAMFTGGFSDALDTQGYVDPGAPHVVNIPPTNVVLNITVYPLGTPFITQPQWSGSQQFGFTVNGASNVNYTVQYATDLAASNWASLFSLTLTNSALPVTDNNATNNTRFYRVLKN